MTIPSRETGQTPAASLDIPTDVLSALILKAREFDALVGAENPDDASDAIDDDAVAILEDRADNPTGAELAGAINALSIDEQVALVALAWLGRGDFEADGWDDAKQLARERRTGSSARYLMGMPMLGDFLEDGAAALGFDLAADEAVDLYQPEKREPK
jgi:Protein of unknown function (DUF3775)